ncbi:hypothetical protein FO519_004006 [Halicephalobus sp. NKZ332]|nr:hypothetical protein FO519_004006 [Halicephalobus sp. NKZ332]
MNSNIKKELIDEVNQLNIKNEPCDQKPTISQASVFEARFDVSSGVTVNVNQHYVSVTDGKLQYYYHHDTQNMTCTVKLLHAKKIRVAFEGLIQQVSDTNSQPINTGVFNLSFVFLSVVQYANFHQQLVTAGYTIIEL